MRFVLALAFVFLLATAPSAQDVGLPDWAAPSAPSSAPAAESMSAPPNPPTAPAQVPIDGGLGLLALAGGAYAARRLRTRQPDEGADDGSPA